MSISFLGSGLFLPSQEIGEIESVVAKKENRISITSTRCRENIARNKSAGYLDLCLVESDSEKYCFQVSTNTKRVRLVVPDSEN